MDLTEVGDALAILNASLNATSAVALVTGLPLHPPPHRPGPPPGDADSGRRVLSLPRVLRDPRRPYGHSRLAGEGLAEVAYFSVLFSHMTLAVVVVPLVLRLLYLVRRRRFHDHAKLARWVLPVWAYVSVTGLVVYVLLYQVYGYT